VCPQVLRIIVCDPNFAPLMMDREPKVLLQIHILKMSEKNQKIKINTTQL
jgi:hypothetical protein